jgi:hypothetical protein
MDDFQSSMGVLFWSASSCVRPRLLAPSRFVFYLYNDFFYIFIFRSRSKYLRSFLRRMRRRMGRLDEEKQNNTIQLTATRTIYTFLSILKLYCAY